MYYNTIRKNIIKLNIFETIVVVVFEPFSEKGARSCYSSGPSSTLPKATPTDSPVEHDRVFYQILCFLSNKIYSSNIVF